MICDSCMTAADEDSPEEHCTDSGCTCQHKEHGTGFAPAS